MKITIVDIETTGGSPRYDRVVEIGMVQIENGIEVRRYQQLINPKRNIPENVVLIHGINQEMVVDAPSFAQVADQIDAFLTDSIFVAHAVQFDYGFIKAEMERAGFSFHMKRLCTARLGRKLLPKLKSYSLASLCRFFNIENKRAHRALEDAEATAALWKHYGQLPEFDATVSFFLTKGSKEMRLLPQVNQTDLQNFPAATGIYRFYDDKGKIIYVGKAQNLKDRVSQHLFGQTHTHGKNKFIQSVCHLDYEVTGSEVMALLLENELIKHHFPRYNSSNKSFQLCRGIFSFTGQDGFLRLQIGPAGKWTGPLGIFPTQAEAFGQLLEWTMEFGLCLKLNGLREKQNTACQYETLTGTRCLHCEGKVTQEKYNEVVNQLIQKYLSDKTLLFKTKGREEAESGWIWLERGKIRGYGFGPAAFPENSLDMVKPFLNSYYDTTDAQSILRQFIKKARWVNTWPDETELFEIPEKTDQDLGVNASTIP